MKTSNKKSTPWLTLIIISLFLVDYFSFYIYMNSPSNESKLDIFSDFGAPYAIQIYQGQYWGVLFNRFLHTNLFLLIINSSIFFFIGNYFEKSRTRITLILLVLFASITTSLIQLTLSNDAGIGFAPVNFCLFSFIYAKSLVNKDSTLPFKHILALTSVVIIVILYYLKQSFFKFDVESMIFIWITGFILGLLSSKVKAQLTLSVLILTLSCATLFYSPWSAEWNYTQGYNFHLANDFKNAKIAYRKALEIEPSHLASRENLKFILIDELKEKALSAHENEDYNNARKLYNELLLIDPNNNWAKENLNKLP